MSVEAFFEAHLRHGIGLLEALTAACAIGHDAVLYTFNTRHFQAVPGLHIEQPYQQSF